MNDKACQLDHRYDDRFSTLPDDQGRAGRHRCAGCAYEAGRASGRAMQENVRLELDALPMSQAGTVRHKSPHAAWALGYQDGVRGEYDLPPTHD